MILSINSKENPMNRLNAWLEEAAARAASAGDYESAAELLTLANAA